MAVEIHAVHRPIHASFLPPKIRNVPTVPVRLRLPSANSAMTRGMDQTNRKNSHGMRNVPPPLAPTIRGKRQMFPVPMAAPMVAKIKPHLEENSSLFAMDIPQSRAPTIEGSSSPDSFIFLMAKPRLPQTVPATIKNSRNAVIAFPNGAR